MAVLSACLDLSPVQAQRTPLSDGGLSDSRLQGPCESCAFNGPVAATCTPEFSACDADPICAAIIVCMRETGCFEVAGGEAVNRCGVPCVLGAGVTNPSHPSLETAVNVAGCAGTNCPGVCFPDPS